jgi:N6-L-threonylcarbamoyladenine synthase
VTLAGIDAVAVTAAPGLIGALLVGVNFAKGLSLTAEKPLIPVHHIRGHVAATYIAHPELKPPFLCLIVSGGHSHIMEVRGYTDFTVLGRTRDDAAGEAFDKVARVLGLPYPGGVHIDRAAREGDPDAYRLPKPRTDNPYDFSFSGLKTAVINLAHNAEQKSSPLDVPGMAASFQRTVCEILTEKFFAAAEATGTRVLACAGGVCANSGLRAMLEARAREAGLALYMPPLSLCGDNAAMIGAQAYYEFEAGHVADLSLNAAASMDISARFM